ncbi:hypothetical protein [Marinobacter sp.]
MQSRNQREQLNEIREKQKAIIEGPRASVNRSRPYLEFAEA